MALMVLTVAPLHGPNHRAVNKDGKGRMPRVPGALPLGDTKELTGFGMIV
jgi:hypothetical protein